MTCYSTEPRTKNHIKGYKFLSFARNLFDKYQKTFLDTTTKRRLDAIKTASKKVAHKEAEAIREFIGNKIADKTVKQKPVPQANFVSKYQSL